jgi:hypothetical protein
VVPSASGGHSVWRGELGPVLAEIRAEEEGAVSAAGVLANLVEAADGSWAVVADPDLVSTYAVTRMAVPSWPIELEWAVVGPDAPLS